MQFEPGNILNEYALPRRESGDTEERWVSSYIIIAVNRHASDEQISCVCIFDVDDQDDHSPGLTICLDFDTVLSPSYGFRGRSIKWRETQIEV